MNRAKLSPTLPSLLPKTTSRLLLAFAAKALVIAGVAGVVSTAPSTAQADQISAEQRDDEAGYMAFEELAYEAIVDASSDYAATLRVRVALHNSSLSTRDVVHTLGLPFASQVVGLRVARDGVWKDGMASPLLDEPGRRDPGSVYVRGLSPASRTDIPGAEVVAFGLEPNTTTQIEVEVRVFPRLRGSRWELDLPARGVGSRSLASERRVLVKGLGKRENFWVDEESNADSPYIKTRPDDMVTVAWPAKLQSTQLLEAQLETSPGPAGFDDGTLRLYVRLGQSQPVKPDHVIVLFDRSLSTPKSMDEHSLRMTGGLLDALPKSTTYDALTFNRHVQPLLDDLDKPAKAHDVAQRATLAKKLAAAPRGQGTDLANALARAAERAKKHRGRTLIVVATDGMFPAQVSPHDIRDAFDAAAAKRQRPDILFVVDEPMLQRSGISISHPVARLAATLGARISLESIANLSTEKAAALLNAPSVLANLGVVLPEGVTLEDSLPPGLVAGSFAVLRGRYVGKPPKKLTLTGRLGNKSVRRAIKATERPNQPDAIAASVAGDITDVAGEGFAEPPWYRTAQRREARRAITQAGRAGRQQRGYLDQKIFRYYLTTRVLPRARTCYNRALNRLPTQGGRVMLEIEVGKGEVMLARTKEADLDTPDPKLVKCMTEAAWALDIPSGKLDDQIYRLRYPLNLIAPEEGKLTGSVTQLSDDVMEILLAQPTPEG